MKPIETIDTALKDYPHPLNALYMGTTPYIISMYPEYKDQSIRGLLAELFRHVRKEERNQIAQLMESLSAELLDVSVNPYLRGTNLICAQAEAVRDNLIGKRWMDAPFPNLACKKDGPFCRVFRDNTGVKKVVTFANRCYATQAK